MELPRSICDAARRSRDARFDGRFFIAVTSTGVYCRSICPARSAKDEHVEYYASAAAAEAAGFRPCLRCRPEASPGTPAWLGTSALVSRALRLIGEGALDEAGLDRLAERLGVTARHVRRLFLRHLGATPLDVAVTRRLHFAKKLVDETSLPFEQVAFAAGFRSVRRFNSEIRRVVLCSGKVYYDLYEEREKRGADDVYLLRVEQLYPVPLKALVMELSRFKGAEVVWCQEEPRNMGAWHFIEPYLEWVLNQIHAPNRRPRYAGRAASAATATGLMSRHVAQLKALLDDALN